MRWSFALLVTGCGFTLQPAPATTDADPSGDAPRSDASDLDAPRDGQLIPDAPPPDAAFDPATCPAGYNQTVTASPRSRYRWIAVNQSWLTQHQDCANDLPGATHLVVLDSIAEAQQIAAASGSVYYQVGAAQAPSQASVQAAWFALTGEPVSASMWHAGQPNDSDGAENGQQDRGSVNTSAGPLIQDVEASFATHAVCECDGKGVAPQVAAFL